MKTRVLKAIGGTMLLVISTPCVVASVVDIATGTDNVVGAAMAGALFLPVLLVGLVLVVLAIRNEDKPVGRRSVDFDPAEEEVERTVLQLASDSGGTISVSELAMKSSLNLDRAEAILEEFESRGIARVEVTPQGAMHYVFPNLSNQPPRDELEEQIHRAAQEQQPAEYES